MILVPPRPSQECVDRWFAARRFQPRSCPLCKQDPLSGADLDAEDLAAGGDGSGASSSGGISMAAAGLGGLFMSALALAAELGEPITRAEVDEEVSDRESARLSSREESLREEEDGPGPGGGGPGAGPPDPSASLDVVVTSVSSEEGSPLGRRGVHDETDV